MHDFSLMVSFSKIHFYSISGLHISTLKPLSIFISSSNTSSLLNQSITKYMRYKFKIRGKNGIPNPFKGIEVKYADTSIVGELKVDKEGKINGFRAKHQVLECNKEKLIVGPRKGFASYVNSKLNENGMNPVTEKELLENRIDFNEHKIPHVEFVEFPEEMRSQYLLYAFPTMLKMAYEYCFITFGEKYLKNPIAMNIRDFLIKYDYKKDTEYCSPTIASLMWISEEERKISLKMYIDNDNIWVQIVLWGMILANICMLEASTLVPREELQEVHTFKHISLSPFPPSASKIICSRLNSLSSFHSIQNIHCFIFIFLVSLILCMFMFLVLVSTAAYWTILWKIILIYASKYIHFRHLFRMLSNIRMYYFFKIIFFSGKLHIFSCLIFP